MPSISEKRRTYREMHQQGCFVLPNPWDIGTARLLAHLGFEALATTSAGYAFSVGQREIGRRSYCIDSQTNRWLDLWHSGKPDLELCG